MSANENGKPRSFFDAAGGFDAGVDAVVREIAEVYLDDDIPWTIGYSGGKDSTATLQLVWLALRHIGAEAGEKARACHQHGHAGGKPGCRRLGRRVAG